MSSDAAAAAVALSAAIDAAARARIASPSYLTSQPALQAAVFDAAVTLSGGRPRAPHVATTPVTNGSTATATATTAAPASDIDVMHKKSTRPSPTSSNAKRRIAFQHKWLSKYALRVVSTDADTSEVLVLACRLCEKYGREKATTTSSDTAEHPPPRTKRRVTSNVKLFKPPWRSDNIAHHARDQHARQFAAYDALSEKQKDAFLVFYNPLLPAAAPASDKSDTNSSSNNAMLYTQAAAAAATTVMHHDSLHPELLEGENSLQSLQAPTDHFTCRIDASIVDVIIVEVLRDIDSPFDPLVNDAALAIAGFTRCCASSTGGSSRHRDLNCSSAAATATWSYIATIPSRHALVYCLRLLAAGVLLPQCAQLLATASTSTASPLATAVRFTRVAIAMNFQLLASILETSYAFTLVLDCSNPSLVDVCVRVAIQTELRVFHVLALPHVALERSVDSSALVVTTLSKLLAALATDWTHKLIGVCIVTGAQATEQAIAPCDAVATQLQALLPTSCFVIDSRHTNAVQQLESIGSDVFAQLLDDAMVDYLVAFTSYVRTQRAVLAAADCTNSAGAIQTTTTVCPRFVDTNWRSIGRFIDWFAATRAVVQRHCDAFEPACAPPPTFYVLMAALKRFRDIVERALQALTTRQQQQQQQQATLAALLQELMVVGYVRGPCGLINVHGDVQSDAANDSERFVFGSFTATRRGIDALLEDLDPFVFALLDGLRSHADLNAVNESDSYASLVARVAFVFGESARRVAEVVTNRNRDNSSDASSSNVAVLPHELVRLSGADMNRLLQAQQLRLRATFGTINDASTSDNDAARQAIYREHAQLVTAYNRDATFRAQLDTMATLTTARDVRFDRAWSNIQALFPQLCAFCAGLATAFPPTGDRDDASSSTVVKYECSAFRTSLVDFELEAQLHAQQFPLLRAVATRMGY